MDTAWHEYLYSIAGQPSPFSILSLDIASMDMDAVL